MPGPEVFEAMGKFNDELISAGVMLAGDGLYPSKDGARVTSKGGELTVKDGPFTETKELIAGFWIITAKDKEEAARLGQAHPVRGRRDGRAAPRLQIRRFRRFRSARPDREGRSLARRQREAGHPLTGTPTRTCPCAS